MVGVVALLIAAAELGLKLLDRISRHRRRRRDQAVARHRLLGHAPPDHACPWPRLEPEVERLREKGAL